MSQNHSLLPLSKAAGFFNIPPKEVPHFLALAEMVGVCHKKQSIIFESVTILPMDGGIKLFLIEISECLYIFTEAILRYIKLCKDGEDL